MAWTIYDSEYSLEWKKVIEMLRDKLPYKWEIMDKGEGNFSIFIPADTKFDYFWIELRETGFEIGEPAG